MPTLTIIRGLPGSGKSTIARELGIKHVEADMYHINAKGEYDWQADRVSDAHAWCQAETLRLLRAGHDVAVANTFTTAREIVPYMEMGYPIAFIEAKGNFQNIHNVPNDVLEKMRERWQPIEMIDYYPY